MSDIQQQREQARDIVLAIWNCIDWDGVGASRRMNIYNELASKIRSAALTDTLEHFFENLCRKMGVKSVSNESILQTITKADARSLLRLYREETQIIILMLRTHQEIKKQKRELGLQ
jgi:hypothetical protein